MKCKKLVVAFVLLLVSVFAPLYSVRAESGINGYEAWIVSVINGTFEYEGRYYRAKDEYIAQATAYLNRDDIDLNEKQAAKAVNYIYSHIADGIASGYIYEISDSTDDDDDTGETTEDSTEDSTEDKDKTTEKSTEDKDKTTEKTTGDKTTEKTTETSTENTTEDKDKTTEKTTGDKDKTTEKSTGDNGDGNSTESTNDTGTEGSTSDSKYGVDLPTDENGAIIIDYSDLDKTAYDDILSEIRLDELEKSDKINVKDMDDRPEKEDAETKVEIDEETGDIIVSTDDDVKRIKTYFSDWVVLTVGIIAVAAFSITVLVVMFAAFNKCFVLSNRKKRKYRKGHSRRKKIRKVSRRILTVAVIFEIIIPALAGSLAFVLFRKNTVMTNLNKGGYFRYEYTNYLIDAAAEISTSTDLSEMSKITGEGENTVDKNGSEEKGTADKNGSEEQNTPEKTTNNGSENQNAADKNSSEVQTDTAKTEVLSYEEFLFRAKNEVSGTLDGRTGMEKILKVNAAKYVHDIRKEFDNKLLLPVMLSIAGMCLALLAMYLLDGIRSRGIRFISLALVITGLVILLVGVIQYMTGLHTKIYAEPDYLYFFIREVILSANRSLVLEGVFMIALGFMSFGLYRNIRKRENS
ncbi:hypothetical protein SAMN04487934_10897 [Eubacterium ruminantium]|nr:hypothetical protein SAMN04487934_10897 [Eubacterium ruminantium]